MQREGLTAPYGYLLIDDTLPYHVGQQIQLIAKLWDHAEQHDTWAHNLVTSFYVNGAQRFPVNFRLWTQFQETEERKQLRAWCAALGLAPTLTQTQGYLLALIRFQARQRCYRTKQDLGQELVRDAVAEGLPFATVLFDGWYLHLDLIGAIEQCHKDWIGGLPKDRLVNWQGRWVQVQHYLKTIPPEAYRRCEIQDTPYWVFTKVLEVKSLQRRVRIVASFDNAALRGEPSGDQSQGLGP